jgi:hypothetical protein
MFEFMNCTFPYTFDGDKCITFADYIGSEYYIWRGFMLTLSILLSFVNFIQLFRFLYYHGYKKYPVQLITLSLSMCMSTMLIIQSIDIQGFMGIMPKIFESLSSNLSTLFGMIILIHMLFSIKYVFVTDNTKNFKLLFGSCFVLFIVTLLIFTSIITFLQVYVERYIFRGIKFIVFSFTMIGITWYLNKLLYKSIQIYNHTMSKKQIYKYYAHIGLFNVLIGFAIIYLIYATINSFSRDGEQEIPEIETDHYIFPLLQALSIVLALSFTSNIKDKLLERLKPKIVSVRNILSSAMVKTKKQIEIARMKNKIKKLGFSPETNKVEKTLDGVFYENNENEKV